MTPAEVAAWVERSRAAQGLPARLEDKAILSKIVTLALAGEGEGGGGRVP
jgi:hypothetical protein